MAAGHMGYERFFTPADRAHTDYLFLNRGSVLGGSGDGVRQRRWVVRPGQSRDTADDVVRAIEGWYEAKRVGDPSVLTDAARNMVRANAAFQATYPDPRSVEMVLPDPLVATEAEEIRVAPPARRASLLRSLVSYFDDHVRNSVLKQFVAHLGWPGPYDRTPEAATARSRPESSQRFLDDQLQLTGQEPGKHWRVADLRRAGFDLDATDPSNAGKQVVPLSASRSRSSSDSQEECAAGCSCDEPCPTNEKLVCRPHQKSYGDYSGEGYGKATRRGWLWDEHPVVKYGCYKCTSESGKRCGFSGPGKLGTYDLYGVRAESRWIPSSNQFVTIPVGIESFTIDPRNTRQYPPEMYEAIRRGTKSCRRAGTCLVDNPPPSPE